MDIGALSKKGKGKGKDQSAGKGGYGSPQGFNGKKGDGKKGGKQSGKDWLNCGKGKGGGGKKGGEVFQGNCSACGQWGHKRAHCPQPRQVGAASADNSNSRASSPAPSISSQGGVVGGLVSDPFWVAGVTLAQGSVGGVATDKYVMLGTGSEEHVCRPSLRATVSCTNP